MEKGTVNKHGREGRIQLEDSVILRQIPRVPGESPSPSRGAAGQDARASLLPGDLSWACPLNSRFYSSPGGRILERARFHSDPLTPFIPLTTPIPTADPFPPFHPCSRCSKLSFLGPQRMTISMAEAFIMVKE